MKYSLEQISDRFEIEDLIAEYADAVDQKEFDRLDDVFTSDAFVDYSAFGGPAGSFSQAKSFLAESLPLFKNTQHLLANYQIKLEGARATGKIMCLNPMKMDRESQTFFLGLWYIDEYIKTQDGWRIAKRSEVRSWDYNTPDFIQFES